MTLEVNLIKDATVVVAVAVFLAVLVEGTIEYLTKPIVAKFPAFSQYIMYVSAVVGIVAAWLYQIDFVALLVNVVGEAQYEPSTFGIIFTGIVIGRGANAVHDIISLVYNNAKRAKENLQQ